MSVDTAPHNRRPYAWVVFASSAALAACLLASFTLFALEFGMSNPNDLSTTLSVCMAATLLPEPRLAVSWRAPQYATVRPIDWVRAYPNIICARVPGVGVLRTRGLLVYPPQE